MATILSHEEATTRLRRLEGMLSDLADQRAEMGRYAEAMEDEGQTGVAIQTAINALLVDWGALRDQIATELSAIPLLHQLRVKVGMPALYSSARIVLNEQSNNADSSISVNQSVETTVSPFSAFVLNDVVSITKAEDPSNVKAAKVVYTPASPGANVVVNGNFTGGSTNWVLSGAGLAYATDNIAWSGGGGSNGVLSQALSVIGWTNGVRYLVEFTLSGVSAGTLSVGTTATAAQHVVTANGAHRALILADNDTAGLKFTGAAFVGTIDAVTAIPWTGLALDDVLGVDNDEDTKVVITLQER